MYFFPISMPAGSPIPPSVSKVEIVMSFWSISNFHLRSWHSYNWYLKDQRSASLHHHNVLLRHSSGHYSSSPSLRSRRAGTRRSDSRSDTDINVSSLIASICGSRASGGPRSLDGRARKLHLDREAVLSHCLRPLLFFFFLQPRSFSLLK